MVAAFCAKSPVYENCRMLAADGQLLSFIDARKLDWYLVRSPPHRPPDQAGTLIMFHQPLSGTCACAARVCQQLHRFATGSA